MVTYQYQCSNCGKRFEAEQSMRDDPYKICPDCEGELKRIISGGSGFILKDGDISVSSSKKILTRCGKTQTCCGSEIPCETPSCEQ